MDTMVLLFEHIEPILSIKMSQPSNTNMTTKDNIDKQEFRGKNKVYELNPFDFGIKTRTRKVFGKDKDAVLISGKTGELKSDTAGFWYVEEVDNAKFVKVYTKGIAALKGLDKAGQRVFEILCLKIQGSVNKELVKLGFSNIDQDATPISKSTYTRGMRELVDNNFIAASIHIGSYWINPDFIWNGDRLAFVKEYRRVDNIAIGSHKDEEGE